MKMVLRALVLSGCLSNMAGHSPLPRRHPATCPATGSPAFAAAPGWKGVIEFPTRGNRICEECGVRYKFEIEAVLKMQVTCQQLVTWSYGHALRHEASCVMNAPGHVVSKPQPSA
jgi:hypothetical protein